MLASHERGATIGRKLPAEERNEWFEVCGVSARSWKLGWCKRRFATRSLLLFAERMPDDREEHRRLEGLAHHVSNTEALDKLVTHHVGASREKDEGCSLPTRKGSKGGGELHAIHTGHHEIENHEVWLVRLNSRQALLAVLGLEDLEALCAERFSHLGPKEPIVIYNKYRGHGVPSASGLFGKSPRQRENIITLVA
jgi:hypothetical protein